MPRFHVGYDLSYLINLPDEQLVEAVSGGAAASMRADLVCLRASGKTMLVPSECDHQSRTGVCLGHPDEPRVAAHAGEAST